MILSESSLSLTVFLIKKSWIMKSTLSLNFLKITCSLMIFPVKLLCLKVPNFCLIFWLITLLSKVFLCKIPLEGTGEIELENLEHLIEFFYFFFFLFIYFKVFFFGYF